MPLDTPAKTYKQSILGHFSDFLKAFENAEKNPKSILIYKGNESAKIVLDILLPELPQSCKTVVIINLDDSIDPDYSLDVKAYATDVQIISDCSAVVDTTFDWIIAFYGFLWNVKTKDSLSVLRQKLNMKGKGSIVLETKGYISSMLQKFSLEPKWEPYAAHLLDGMLLYDSDLAMKDDLRGTFRKLDFKKTTIINHYTWYEFPNYKSFKGYIDVEFKQLKPLFETEEGYEDLLDDILKEMKQSKKDVLIKMIEDVYIDIKVPIRNTMFLFSRLGEEKEQEIKTEE